MSMTLDEAIAQLIELGEKDPHEIARKIESRYGNEWLATTLVELAEDIIAGFAARALTASRRSAVARITSARVLQKAELGLESLWVPNLFGKGVSGWKPMNECSPDDFDAVSRARVSLASAVLRQAEWFSTLAERMRAENAATFAEFRGELPELSRPDELEAA